MKFLITQRKSPGVALAMGALVCVLLGSACTTNSIKSDPSNKEASAQKPQFSPPKAGDPFYENKALPKSPEVLANAQLPQTEVKNVADVIEPVQEKSADPTRIKRSALDRFIKKGPRHALKIVSVQPAFQGSRFIGYQVVGLTDAGAQFSNALKSGDIVTTVNDKNIVRPEDYMAAWESLKTCENVSIKLMREGKEVELSWAVANH